MSEAVPAAPRTVLCYGDSNTHGTLALRDRDDQRRLPRGQRWPDVMAADLGPGWEVIAEGHPGRTTVHDDPVEGPHRNGLTMLLATLETHRPLDVVVLMLGTNDVKPRFSVTAADIAGCVERLGRMVLASGTGPGKSAPRLVVVSPVPVQEAGCLAATFEGGAAKAAALAPLLAVAAERLGAGFVDAGALATVDPVDGVHLTREAHAAIGTAVAAAVRERCEC